LCLNYEVVSIDKRLVEFISQQLTNTAFPAPCHTDEDYIRFSRSHVCHMSSSAKNLYSIMCTRSQSGHIQVGPLLIPHLFSAKHSGQISKPQVQRQQKGFSSLQQ
jgi:hypothetical protein